MHCSSVVTLHCIFDAAGVIFMRCGGNAACAAVSRCVKMYRHADGYRGKRVVVVGVGTSACDAAVDLSSVCNQVTAWRLILLNSDLCVTKARLLL